MSAPKTSVLTWLVWVGPGTKGPVHTSVALSSSQVEGGRSHTAKGVCEAAARVWGAAEPAHQGGPAQLRVSVPLGLYTAAPHPTPLGTSYPIVSAGSAPQPLFPPTLLPSLTPTSNLSQGERWKSLDVRGVEIPGEG